MFRWRSFAAIACVALVMGLSACSTGSSHREHYVSSEIQGEKEKINLEEVQKAFFETKGKDFNSQMGAFEKRVNEIYDGEGVVALDATREDNKLKVIGFISKSDKPGLQPGDEKLFTIEQTGDVVQNEMPYRVSGYNDRPYYEGHRSILDSPFVQMMVLSHMMGGMGGFGGRYYTPYSSYGSMMGYRNTWRQSPQYAEQKTANSGFFSRFGKKSDGSLRSNTTFGGSGFSNGTSTQKRSWGGFGSGSSSTTSTSSSSWGGRRSGGIFSSGRSGGGGWGRRRGR